MLHDQSLLEDLDGLVTDHLDKVCLLSKCARPQLQGFGPIVFMDGLVVVVTCDCGSAHFRFRFLSHRAYGLSCRALQRYCQLAGLEEQVEGI